MKDTTRKFLDKATRPLHAAQQLVDNGLFVLLVDGFMIGDHRGRSTTR